MVSPVNGGFRYLKLSYNPEGGINAEVCEDGNLKFVSVGSDTTRMSYGPFAVFQIEEFTGLANIYTEDLISEIRRRLSHERIVAEFMSDVSADDILAQIRRRMSS